MGLLRVSLPHWFVVAGLALAVWAIVENELVAGAGGAVAGVSAALIQYRRLRLYRGHVAALRERLRTHRQESEEATAQLRQTVSALQTELWQHRLVALATPTFGLQMSALTAAADEARAEQPRPADGGPPKPLAHAS